MNDQNQKPKEDELAPNLGFEFGISFGFGVSGFTNRPPRPLWLSIPKCPLS
jgi:hypothetical protein